MDRVSYEKALKNFNKMYIVFTISLLIILVIISGSLAAILSNNVKVKTDSDLTYYINVSYDGVDKNGVSSSDSVVSEIGSGYLYVEDKIPDGLEFDGFVTTNDGTIGAVKRSDNSSCIGKVIDDTNDNGVWNEDKTEYTYHGLHYDSETRVVKFTVKNLNAGCKLVVGVKTKTPKKIDDLSTEVKETRRDFYTYASVREDDLTVNSGIVNFYIGSDFAKLYKVKYEYFGDVPKNAPKLPDSLQYISGASISTLKNIDLDGYDFSGWTSNDVEISNNKFIMPSSDIVLKGSFKKKKSYNIKYVIDGDMPLNYVVPNTKKTYKGNYVDLDSLGEGTIIGDYKFLGWTSLDVSIDNGSFEMPNKDVTIVGTFEKVKYSVIYKFYDTILPDNYEKLLPDVKSYMPGENVKLESIDDVDGYKFLGWYNDNNFSMPKNDVTIYGEWKKIDGTFKPDVTVNVLSKKEYYRVGDIVDYEIIIKNDSSFDIYDVTLKSDTLFEENEIGNILSDGFVLIDKIDAFSSVILHSSYIVKKTDKNKLNNYVEVIDAYSNDGYELSDDMERISVDVSLESKLNLCQNVDGAILNNNFQYHITSDDGYDTWITLSNNKCISINLIPGKYYINQVVSQEYNVISSDLVNDDNSLLIEKGKDYNISFTNKYNKKLFFHSYGRSFGVILGGDVDESQN